MDEHAFFERLQATHVAAWNEKDTDKRMALLAEIYAADVTMYDKDNIFYGLQSVSVLSRIYQTKIRHLFFPLSSH